MLATLTLERDPLRWQDLPGYAETWIQIAGGLSGLALIIWLVLRLVLPKRQRQTAGRPVQNLLFWLAFAGAVAGYGPYLVFKFLELLSIILKWLGVGSLEPPPFGSAEWHRNSFNIGAACALLAVALPLLADLLAGRLSSRRIWALARLSFKEAIRSKVLWAFSSFLVVLLFASWFITSKEEDEVRTYVRVVYWVMTPLLLGTAALLASFSIPSDVRSQTIHTIVTKPVERFELVLGRFFGFAMLMTLVLAVMTGISLLYVVRTTTGASPFSFLFPEMSKEATFESLRARVPVYGVLNFYSGKDPKYEGISVGREWEYRRYLAGNSAQRAVWTFRDFPADLPARPEATVPCEFSFDIFRTLKGEEGKGVLCSFEFRTRNWDKKMKPGGEEWEQERHKLEARPEDVNYALAEKCGYFEILNKEVKDYHTQSIDIPTGLFKDALATRTVGVLDRIDKDTVTISLDGGGQRTFRVTDDTLIYGIKTKSGGRPKLSDLQEEHQRRGEETKPALRVSLVSKYNDPEIANRLEATEGAVSAVPPGQELGPLQVFVKCESGGQYLGVARYDFYILAHERSFAGNFVKGAAGLWLRMCLVLAIAVTCSTYLNGVVSFVAAQTIYVSGFFMDYIRSLAENTSIGGGPLESFIRLATREAATSPLDPTPGVQAALGTDVAIRWYSSLYLKILPDVDRFDWTDYVAEGFNIATVNLFSLSGLMLIGYLLPWAILSYYLIKTREIATW
jgi:hypothetical protein